MDHSSAGPVYRHLHQNVIAHFPRRGAMPTAIVASLLLLAACTSGSSSHGGSGTTSTAQAASASGPKMNIIMISGGLSDPFYAAFKQGGQQAAAQLGVRFQYLTFTDPSNPTESQYIQDLNTAIAEKPSAIIISDYFPSGDDPILKKEAAAGLPIVENNTGAATWQQNGAIGFVGQDETLAGEAAGKAEAAAGVKVGLCVVQFVNNVALVDRCQGYTSAMEAAGDKAITLIEPGTDGASDAATTADIAGELRSHPNIDGIFTLGSGYALDAIRAAQEVGRPEKIGTTDISTEVLADVQSGKLLFTIDQQPYLQGYYSVLIAYQYVKYGLRPVTQITTGPLLITKSNVGQLEKINQEYPGIRGAS
jgi:simple sugar transport system substrate-binding protein